VDVSEHQAGDRELEKVNSCSLSCLLFCLIGIAKDFFTNDPFGCFIQVFM